jgi:hypothetical protein
MEDDLKKNYYRHPKKNNGKPTKLKKIIEEDLKKNEKIKTT